MKSLTKSGKTRVWRKQWKSSDPNLEVLAGAKNWRELCQDETKTKEIFVHRPRFDWLIRDHDQVLNDFWFTLIAQVLIWLCAELQWVHNYQENLHGQRRNCFIAIGFKLFSRSFQKWQAQFRKPFRDIVCLKLSSLVSLDSRIITSCRQYEQYKSIGHQSLEPEVPQLSRI